MFEVISIKILVVLKYHRRPYYQNFIELTPNTFYIVAFCGGLKCPRKIHLNTQWRGLSIFQIYLVRVTLDINFLMSHRLLGCFYIHTVNWDFCMWSFKSLFQLLLSESGNGGENCIMYKIQLKSWRSKPLPSVTLSFERPNKIGYSTWFISIT